jgi:hypothetical protein
MTIEFYDILKMEIIEWWNLEKVPFFRLENWEIWIKKIDFQFR